MKYNLQIYIFFFIGLIEGASYTSNTNCTVRELDRPSRAPFEIRCCKMAATRSRAATNQSP